MASRARECGARALGRALTRAPLTRAPTTTRSRFATRAPDANDRAAARATDVRFVHNRVVEPSDASRRRVDDHVLRSRASRRAPIRPAIRYAGANFNRRSVFASTRASARAVAVEPDDELLAARQLVAPDVARAVDRAQLGRARVQILKPQRVSRQRPRARAGDRRRRSPRAGLSPARRRASRRGARRARVCGRTRHRATSSLERWRARVDARRSRRRRASRSARSARSARDRGDARGERGGAGAAGAAEHARGDRPARLAATRERRRTDASSSSRTRASCCTAKTTGRRSTSLTSKLSGSTGLRSPPTLVAGASDERGAMLKATPEVILQDALGELYWASADLGTTWTQPCGKVSQTGEEGVL